MGERSLSLATRDAWNQAAGPADELSGSPARGKPEQLSLSLSGDKALRRQHYDGGDRAEPRLRRGPGEAPPTFSPPPLQSGSYLALESKSN